MSPKIKHELLRRMSNEKKVEEDKFEEKEVLISQFVKWWVLSASIFSPNTPVQTQFWKCCSFWIRATQNTNLGETMILLNLPIEPTDENNVLMGPAIVNWGCPTNLWIKKNKS